MVVGAALPLVDVDNAVQVQEIAVQVHSLRVTAAYKPILYLSGLSRRQEGGLAANPAAKALDLAGLCRELT